jgi:serine-type D-Ala-D-Ala carboxypeptidase (penicillin-binding protein 5/6)
MWSFLKKFLLILLLVLFISSSYFVVAFAETEGEEEQQLTDEELIDLKPIFNEGKVDAETVLLIDAKTGLVLYEKDSDKQIYPASTTKILTCLIALEETEMSDLITCGEEVIFPIEYSVMGVKPGEIVTARDLIYGLMLVSGNDAAAALAVYIGGTIEGFAEMMNKKAEELGMTDTHFENPHGAHADNHFSTASDMAIVSIAAYNNPDFMKIVGTSVYQPEDTNMATAKELIDNSNRLIRGDIGSYAKWYNEYATGMKTGHTSNAGYCLVASMSKDTQDIIALMFNHGTNEGRFNLANELFVFGYENYGHVDLLDVLGDSVIREPISNATSDDPNGGYMEFVPNIDSGTYFTETNNFISALISSSDEINVMVDLDADLRAPIIKGEVYGKVIYQYRDHMLLRSELVADYDMLDYATDYLTFQEEDPNVVITPPKDLNSGTAPAWWWMVFPALLILLIIYKVLTYKRSKFKKRQTYNEYSD